MDTQEVIEKSFRQRVSALYREALAVMEQQFSYIVTKDDQNAQKCQGQYRTLCRQIAKVAVDHVTKIEGEKLAVEIAFEERKKIFDEAIAILCNSEVDLHEWQDQYLTWLKNQNLKS